MNLFVLLLLHLLVPLLVCSAFQLRPTPLQTRMNIEVVGFSPTRSCRLSLYAKMKRQGNSPKSTAGGTKRQSPTKNTKSNNKSKTSSSSKQPQAKKKAAIKNTKSASTPPWQVLSTKDAKLNIEKEKIRRERARQGDHHVDDDTRQQQTLSTAFLSEAQQQFLNWKRFNPVSVPAGMTFVGSYLDRRLPPSLGVPEVAFLGRSNVGKSSLLNRLSTAAAGGAQARVGKTPGATASVNLYALHDAKQKYLLGWADLPGFGYAKLSKQVQESVQAAAENYLGKRRELCLGILLVDIRREPSDDDRAVLAALYDLGVPLVVVATKIDKVSKNQLSDCLEVIQKGLGLPEGQPFAVSSTTGEGTRDLWKIIMEACQDGVASQKLKYDEETRKQKDIQDKEDTVATATDGAYFEDDDDIAYNQGFDWVHGDTDMFYDDQGEFGDDEEYHDDDDNFNRDTMWDDFERESLRDLQRRARDMERRGEL